MAPAQAMMAQSGHHAAPAWFFSQEKCWSGSRAVKGAGTIGDAFEYRGNRSNHRRSRMPAWIGYPLVAAQRVRGPGCDRGVDEVSSGMRSAACPAASNE